MNKTAKALALILLGTSLVLVSGCKQTKAIGDKFIDDSKKTYDNAAKEVNKAKDATIQKANEIQDAANKIKAATDAVQKVTGDKEPTKTPPKK